MWAEVLALDLDSDLALVRPRSRPTDHDNDDGFVVDYSKYPPVTITEATVQLGEPIATLGKYHFYFWPGC